jgi:hypothetical protein
MSRTSLAEIGWLSLERGQEVIMVSRVCWTPSFVALVDETAKMPELRGLE